MAHTREFLGFRRGIATVLVTSAALLSVAPNALAQTDDDRAGARVAATEGVKASNEKRWADAADLFTRAESLVHSPVHLLYLARAQEKLGRLVKSRENYNRVIRERVGADSPEAFKQAQATAQQEVGGVEARLAAVTIKVEGETGTTTVTMDGEKVPPALVGLPLPVDPGNHTFQAVGANLKSDAVTVSVSEGGKNSVTLVVKAAPGFADPFGAAPAATVPGPTTTPIVRTDNPIPPNTGETTRPVTTGVYVGLAATGVLAIGAGVTGVLALGKHSDYEKANNGSDPGNADSIKSSGQTLSLVSDIFTVGAVVAAGVTTYLYFSRPEVPAAQSGSIRFVPSMGRDGAAFSLSGRF